jgi:hypothetical protein
MNECGKYQRGDVENHCMSIILEIGVPMRSHITPLYYHDILTASRFSDTIPCNEIHSRPKGRGYARFVCTCRFYTAHPSLVRRATDAG